VTCTIKESKVNSLVKKTYPNKRVLAKTDQKKVSSANLKKSSKSNMSILTMDAQKASKACERCTLEKTKAPGAFFGFRGIITTFKN
jgi:hypothetical protein